MSFQDINRFLERQAMDGVQVISHRVAGRFRRVQAAYGAA